MPDRFFHRFSSLIVVFAMLLQFVAPLFQAPLDAAPPEQTSETSTLDEALTIARVQSSYHSGDEITITYVIHNNYLPTAEPLIPPNATYTDTVDLMAAFDPTTDANAMHNVAFSTTLTSNATFVDSSLPPTQNGNTYSWELPDILPYGRYVFTMTVQAANSASNFANLDNGAGVAADLWDARVSDSARPAVLVPDSINADFTEGTVDADPFDKDMLWASAVFAQDPIAAFEMVRAFMYDPYEGSLRGTRGTLWGESGNSADQSSLLIAILRAAGVPARYRHGTLGSADIDTLLASMFPAPKGLAGYVPSDAETAEPLNDPNLIALAADHWWVEAYLPGQGWTNLDPSFPDAQVGDIFATPGTNDQIAELPDSVRHYVTLSLEVEQYSTFPIGGVNLVTSVPLSATYPTAQIAAKPVSIGHFVISDVSGAVFTTISHTYTPYFAVEGDDFLTAGDEFQDLLTNFPLATVFTTAEWLTVETEDVDGNTTTFTREVKDIIGLDARLNGGNLNIQPPADNGPFTDFDDAFALWFLPNQVAASNYAARSRAVNMYAVLEKAVTAETLPDTAETPEEIQAFNEAKLQYFLTRNQQFALGGLAFAELADPAVQDIERNLRVKLFYEQPRIIIASSAAQVDGAVLTTMDLRSTEATGIVYPEQAVEALASAQWLKGVAESYFEGAVISQLTGETPLMASRLFDEMSEQGIEPMLVTPANMDLLALYLPDSAAYAHAVDALLEGKNILIPQSPVMIDGEPTLGWWEIDPETGVATSVLQNGLHGVLIEYATLVELFGLLVTLYEAGQYAEFVAEMWACIARNVVPALQGNPQPTENCIPEWFSPVPPWVPIDPFATRSVEAVPWRFLPAHQCPVANCGLEQFALPYPAVSPIPLPEMSFSYNDRFGGAVQAARTITVTDNGGGGGPSLTLGSTPSSGSTLPGDDYLFDVTADANFNGLVNVWAYVPNGLQVRFDDNLQANVVAKPGTPPGDYTVQLVGQPQDFPELVVTAEHTLTVLNANSLELAWAVEPNITIPMDVAAEQDVSNQTNDGQPEIPDSAFRLAIANNSGQSKTIDLTVSGAPAGWVVLNGAEQTAATITLAPNERAQVGLYVLPPTTPTPGTSFNMNVQISDGGGGSDSAIIPWNMPGQAHNYLQVSPETLYLSPNQSGDLILEMSNVGNQSGSFPISLTTPLTGFSLVNLQSPVSLAVDQTKVQTPTLSIGANAPHGHYPLVFSSPAPGSYTQYAMSELFILTENAGNVAAAAACAEEGSGLSASLQSLALAADDLEVSCNAGSCSENAKERTIDALDSVIYYASLSSPHLTVIPDLQSVANDLALHTNTADILADLANLGTTAEQLGLELCEISEHEPDGRFTPYLDAILLGDTAVMTLTVTNLGSIETTYDVTVTTPTGDQTFNPTIAPGDETLFPIATTPGLLGSYDLAADIVPTGPDVLLDIHEGAVARLNVVDKFVQVTAVTADPAFVETGVSSATLSVEVANIAGIQQNVTAHTEVLAPDGDLQWSDDIPLTLLIGNPRVYDLATIETSGWTAGVYTMTVDLGVSEGEGYGYLGVGQALGASHSVSPELAPPGTVTVTTVITTELVEPPIQPPPAAQPLQPWPERPLLNGYVDIAEPTAVEEEQQTEAFQPPFERPQPAVENKGSLLTTWAITRTEDSAAAVTYTGSWSAVINSLAARASNNDYHSSQTTGDYAAYDFNGTWVAVGFATGTTSGHAEIFIDGASQGLVDLYSRDSDVKRVTLSGLPNAAHVITVTVTGIQNPFSSNDLVILDYFDTWDGTNMPDGMVEQDDGRVWLSGGWSNQNHVNASGGSYYRNGQTAWYPFTGDSITFQAIASSNSEKIALYLDDDFQGYYNIDDFTTHTRTFTFDSLGAGPHMLTVRAFRNQATIDTFTTPATGPATPPPVIGSFHRYEEYEHSVLYNGFSFPQTAQTWASAFNDVVSDHYLYYSGNPGDTAEFTFEGTTAIIGLYGSTQGGYAEISLDGVSIGIADTYRRDSTPIPLHIGNLADITHTISVTVLGQKNPFASNDYVQVDYIDIWDGTPLPDGTFEELDGRVYRSYRWSLLSNAEASGGQYLQDSITSFANVWFPFSGDSVTFHTIASAQGSETTKVYIDGQLYTYLNLYNNVTVSRTYSFEGLGPGLHILQLERYRGELAVDAFTTPGAPPFTQPALFTGVVRYEEDDPALLYNGFPYQLRPQSWSEELQFVASGGYAALSTVMSNTVSLEFDGRWVNVGFYTNVYGGQAEIFVDGISQGTIGLYSPQSDVANFVVSDLLTGTHTISVTVLGLTDPPSTQTRVYLDYIDVWDGQTMSDDIANANLTEDNGRVHYSNSLTYGQSPNAIEGDYVGHTAGSPDANVWYAFTGDSFTFYGLSDAVSNAKADVYVDGQFLETVDLYYPFSQQPIAFGFDSFGDGPHLARINNNVGFQVDAFGSNQPLDAYRPLAEWWESDRSGGASIWGGVHVPAVVGDVTGDGLVEVVVASSNIDNNGELFVMRGDGQDAGGGDPIIWSYPFNIFNGFEDVGSPAIAELDGQPGAEIVMSTIEGMYAFHGDGTTYWYTDTYKPHVFFGTPAIGNLDLDDEPEIVINMDETMVVFNQDGSVAWTFNDPQGLTMPLLADLTNDGLTDILFHNWDDTLYLYDFNLGSPQLVWTAVFTNQLYGYGAPAIADLDGDGTAEIAMASETRLFAINSEDGSIQWSAVLDPGSTGGVTVADIDGDDAPELVTSSLYNGGALYAFEHDGTLKWTVPALDSSPLNTSAADLDNDGAFEILWNGINQGFTIYDGQTGDILFIEPQTKSATGSDVPVAADVDLDGYLEVVVPAQGGIRVFGFDGVWGEGRPLWNQLNYHVTNINDDLTVPFNEINSWEVHNTYRTQTPLTNPLPNYGIVVSHTAAISGVMVLSNTFNIPPTTQTPPLYGWDYDQNWTSPVVTRTFQSQLANMQPGETRLVAEGTEVAYMLTSGYNQLTLPPLYVTAARLATIEPPIQTRPAGGTAVYTLTLTNLADSPAVYTLTVNGPLAGWTDAPDTVNVPANGQATALLTVNIPVDADPETLPLLLEVDDGFVSDELNAELTIVDGVDVSISPTMQFAPAGEAVTYTLTITNLEAAGQDYTVTPTGLANITLPGSFFVLAGQSETFIFSASGTNAGLQPFTLQATADSGASDSADAVLDVQSGSNVALALSPDPVVSGPGSTAVMTLTVANTGNLPDTFDLDTAVPAGWSASLLYNGQPVSEVTLPPFIFNSRDLTLLITPANGALPGNYDVTASAVSQSSPLINDDTTGTVQLINRGVQIRFLSGPTTVDPRDTAVWQVRVTNTGQVADTFNLQAAGPLALAGSFSVNSVTLAAGQAQTVQFTADEMESFLPGVYDLIAFAQSQANSNIKSMDIRAITLTSYEEVTVAFTPLSQTLTDTLTATYMLVVTNTGNINTLYELSVDAPGANGSIAIGSIQLPAHNVAMVIVTVVAPGPGTYTVTGTAVSDSGSATDSAAATLIIPGDPPPPGSLIVYIPAMRK